MVKSSSAHHLSHFSIIYGRDLQELPSALSLRLNNLKEFFLNFLSLRMPFTSAPWTIRITAEKGWQLIFEMSEVVLEINNGIKLKTEKLHSLCKLDKCIKKNHLHLFV